MFNKILVEYDEGDLLALGLHRHSLLFSRLWNRTMDGRLAGRHSRVCEAGQMV